MHVSSHIMDIGSCMHNMYIDAYKQSTCMHVVCEIRIPKILLYRNVCSFVKKNMWKITKYNIDAYIIFLLCFLLCNISR